MQMVKIYNQIMKKVLIFIAGVVTGAILMLVIAALIGNSSNGESSNNGMTFFEKEGDCISENNFEVQMCIRDRHWASSMMNHIVVQD